MNKHKKCLFFLLLVWSFNYAQQPLIENDIHAKAILKKPTSILTNPSNSGTPIGADLPEFTILYLFHKPSGGSQKNGFQYVGTAPDEALGWVKNNALIRWNHRQCLHFSELVGREAALVYPNYRYAKQSIETRDRIKGVAIAEEPGNIGENRYGMLLPIIEHKQFRHGGKMQKAFKVAYLGEPSTDYYVAGEAPTLINTERTALELLFVVDATSSMEEYIKGIKNVILAIADRVNGIRESGIYYGLVAYQDRLSMGKLDYVTKRHLKLTKNFKKVTSTIEQVRVTKEDSEDKAEAVYDGLFSGITETSWSKSKSSLRMVILIGDASAHEGDNDKNPMVYTLDQIQKEASDNRIRIIALQLNPGDSKTDAEKFANQLQGLAQGVRNSDKGFYAEIEMDYDGKINPQYIQTLTLSIEKEIVRLEALTKEEKKRGSMSNLTVDDKAIILKNLKVSNNTKDIEFSEGWITAQDINGRPQVIPHVFLTKDELSIYLLSLQSIITTSTANDNSLLRAIVQTLKVNLGDQFSQTSNLKDYLKKRFGLPLNDKFFNNSLADIQSWSTRKKQGIIDEIKRKKKLLEEYGDNPRNWRTFPNTTQYYTFIPIAKLP